MRIRLASLVLAIVLLVDPSRLIAQAVAFAMLYDGSDLAGWQLARPTNAEWRKTFVPGGGPNGEAIWRVELLYGNSGENGTNGGQFNLGWHGQQLPVHAYGSKLYISFWMRFTTASNFRCRAWDNGGNGDNCKDKMLIVDGDGCSPGNCRFIMTAETERADQTYKLRLQKDGGAHLVDSPTMQRGTWYLVVIALDYSTAQNRADGGYRLYLNQPNEATPTVRMANIPLNVGSDNRYLRWGGFMNHGVENGGTWVWEHFGFQVTTSFPGTTPPQPVATPPATPTLIRVG